jgi:CHAT domain-containing protein
MDDGTVTLGLLPLDAAWAAFTARAGVVMVDRVAAPVDAAHLDAAARALAGWAAPRTASARRIRVLAFGLARSLDLERVEVEGAPLAARAPFEYVLPGVVDGAPRRGVPLVVGDPTGALPHAREEARVLAAALAETGAAPRPLLGGEATRAQVLGKLVDAPAFTFSGHGAFEGVDGWDSALFLAEGQRITVADVLALASVPPLVVLSACETARDRAEDADPGVGLADAFVASGAKVVVGAVRPVPDVTAGATMRAFAAALVSSGGDAVAALHAAQRDVQTSDPALDVSAFRAFTAE